MWEIDSKWGGSCWIFNLSHYFGVGFKSISVFRPRMVNDGVQVENRCKRQKQSLEQSSISIQSSISVIVYVLFVTGCVFVAVVGCVVHWLSQQGLLSSPVSKAIGKETDPTNRKRH